MNSSFLLYFTIILIVKFYSNGVEPLTHSLSDYCSTIWANCSLSRPNWKKRLFLWNIIPFEYLQSPSSFCFHLAIDYSLFHCVYYLTISIQSCHTFYVPNLALEREITQLIYILSKICGLRKYVYKYIILVTHWASLDHSQRITLLDSARVLLHIILVFIAFLWTSILLSRRKTN